MSPIHLNCGGIGECRSNKQHMPLEPLSNGSKSAAPAASRPGPTYLDAILIAKWNRPGYLIGRRVLFRFNFQCIFLRTGVSREDQITD
jgi:hypothetical protein